MVRLCAAAALACVALTGAAQAEVIKGGSGIGGSTVIDFEGRSEGDFIDTQFSGITFTQDVGGRPMIDNSPFLYGYYAFSGVGVLTGSMEGGDPYPTIAGLVAKFDTPQNAAGAYISDWGPLGDYPITAYRPDGSVLETFTVTGGEVAGAPGSALFVGFKYDTAEIGSIQFGRSTVFGDAFGIDDFQYTGIPAPAGLGVLGLGALAAARRRRA